MCSLKIRMGASDRRSILQHTAHMVTYGAWSRKSSLPPPWRKHLAIPLSVYGLSSFTYTIVGLHALALWTACPSAIPEWPQSIAVIEACLVTLQGLWSFCSDVLNAARDSSFHIVDRVSAVSLLGLQFVKLGGFMRNMPTEHLMWMWSGLIVAIVCKLRGYRAILDGSRESFRFWHIVWHFSLPLAAGLLHSSRWRAAGACEIMP